MIRRRLFTFASTVSLLLCVASVVMWVRSYRAYDHMWQYWASKMPSGGLVEWWSEIGSIRGGAILFNSRLYGRTEITGLREAGKPYYSWRTEPARGSYPKPEATSDVHHSSTVHQAIGFGLLVERERWPQYSGHLISIVIPWPALVALTGFLPSFGIYRWNRTRLRLKEGALCSRCSYNLTGNVSGVCPECGTAVAEKADQSAPR